MRKSRIGPSPARISIEEMNHEEGGKGRAKDEQKKVLN
jgi:hypothetical protein